MYGYHMYEKLPMDDSVYSVAFGRFATVLVKLFKTSGNALYSL